MRPRQKDRTPVKRVKFRNKLCDYMPFRSAHRHNDDSATAPNYPDSTPDNQSNITEIVNALRDTTREGSEAFKIDFDVRHKRATNDIEYNQMEHVLTLDVCDRDGKLVVNLNNHQFDMTDAPKLRNVMDPKHPLYDLWCKGILTELLGMQANKIMQPIALDTLTSTERKHLLPSQIILKMKRSSDENQTPTRAKARWVVGGHRAVSKEDTKSDYYHYDEVAAKGCQASTLRLLTALSVYIRRLLFATDIKQAFTSAELDPANPNRIIIRLPKELETRDSRGVPIVCLLL